MNHLFKFLAMVILFISWQLAYSQCSGIDISRGFPNIPLNGICSGETAEVCFFVFDESEGLVVELSLNGSASSLVGIPNGDPNVLCVTFSAPVNESCDAIDALVVFNGINCSNGQVYPGVFGGTTLVDDFDNLGFSPRNIPIFPTLSVATAGNGSCGLLIAELRDALGNVCATESLPCSGVDDTTLDYNFSSEANFDPSNDEGDRCPLPTLSGSLICSCIPTPTMDTWALVVLTLTLINLSLIAIRQKELA